MATNALDGDFSPCPENSALRWLRLCEPDEKCKIAQELCVAANENLRSRGLGAVPSTSKMERNRKAVNLHFWHLYIQMGSVSARTLDIGITGQ